MLQFFCFPNRGPYLSIHIFLAGLEIPGGPPQIEKTSEVALGEPGELGGPGEPGEPDELGEPGEPRGPGGPDGPRGPRQIEET